MGWSQIDKNGIRDFLVNIGGEIFARRTNRNGNRWGVGVETPIEGNMTPGRSIERRVDVSDKAVATSGNYRNFRTDAAGRKFTHIIDPTSGNNTESNLLSASVVAENCARADALGTMYITLGLDGSTDIIEEHPELAVLLIYADQDGNLLTYYSAAMKPYLGNN